MKRAKLKTGYSEGFLGGGTTTFLQVTERKDKSISLKAGTEGEDCGETQIYWEKGVCGIRHRSELLKNGKAVASSLGGDFLSVLGEVRELGEAWDNELLRSL